MTLQPLDRWRDDVSYLAGAVVLHAGRAWTAQRATHAGERPGTGDGWRPNVGAKAMPANPMLAGRR